MKENIIYFHFRVKVWPLISVAGTQSIGTSGDKKKACVQDQCNEYLLKPFIFKI